MDNKQVAAGLVKRAIERHRARSTDQAEAPMTMPVSAYQDPFRYKHEVDRIFKRLPLALALSIELKEPGSFRTMEVVGVPVLIARGQDGVARAFVNACRHRGAPVCEAKSGKADRFTCRYHAWSYGHSGDLIAMYGSSTFGDIDRKAFGLTPLPCAERCGLIWVALKPDVPFDIDAFLGDFAGQLNSLKLESWHLYDQREIDGPGWKVALDGYLECYHHNTLHADTVGKFTIGNLLLHDTYGPHQRITFGRKSLIDIMDKPEAEWGDPEQHVRLIHGCFPNLSISGILGDHCLVSQIFPGPTPDVTLTRQSVLSAKEPKTPEEKAATETFSRITLQAVRDEDYAIGLKIQKGLDSGGNKEFVFGRNEPALQHYHKWVARLSAVD
jgi:phenylpropionate dioxygenase-like ring-hydroxylating dioxygenase large terminal subunit